MNGDAQTAQQLDTAARGRAGRDARTHTQCARPGDKRLRRQAAARDAALSIQLVANETLTNQQYKHYRQPMKRHRARRRYAPWHQATATAAVDAAEENTNGGRKTSKNQRTNWEIGQRITISRRTAGATTAASAAWRIDTASQRGEIHDRQRADVKRDIDRGMKGLTRSGAHWEEGGALSVPWNGTAPPPQRHR